MVILQSEVIYEKAEHEQRDYHARVDEQSVSAQSSFNVTNYRVTEPQCRANVHHLASNVLHGHTLPSQHIEYIGAHFHQFIGYAVNATQGLAFSAQLLHGSLVVTMRATSFSQLCALICLARSKPRLERFSQCSLFRGQLLNFAVKNLFA